MKEKGIIASEEHDKVKKRLINRVGKLVLSKKLKNSFEAINQIERMSDMQEKEIISKKEFDKKKKRMLIMI